MDNIDKFNEINKFCDELSGFGGRIIQDIYSAENHKLYDGVGIVVQQPYIEGQNINNVGHVSFDITNREHCIFVHPFPQQCLDGTEFEKDFEKRYGWIEPEIRFRYVSQFIFVVIHETGYMLHFDNYIGEELGTLEDYIDENTLHETLGWDIFSASEVYADYIAVKYYIKVKNKYYDDIWNHYYKYEFSNIVHKYKELTKSLE
jgi:hypothetical protein